MYNVIVTRIKNVRPHPNADKVKLASCCGNQVVIGLDNQEDELGMFFMSDGQLSHEFCSNNNLYRDKLKNIDKEARPGMFDDNRRVRAQKFRGSISDGFWIPMTCLRFITKDESKYPKENEEFCELKGIPICNKYINPATLKMARENGGKKSRNAKTSIMFKEHFDTAHFGKNMGAFGKGQYIILSEKKHGTSFRIGHVLVDKPLNWFEKFLKKFIKIQNKEWQYLNGTRRVVIEESKGTQYHDPTIRDKAFKLFNGNLRKGETVFGEIVGYESTGATIMPSANTLKMNDKEFTGKYGEIMTYSYGCEPTECEVYVYRMTTTNEDGQSVDYCWDDVVNRCNEMGVKHVTELRRITFEELELINKLNGKSCDDRDIQETFVQIVENLVKGSSTVDERHIREGVCIRIEGGLNNRTFKYKSFEFRVLEGLVKDSGVVDMEEAQDIN